STHHVNGSAICGLYRLARGLFESDSGQKFGTVLLRVTRKRSGFLAMINYLPEGEAGLDHLGRQSVHLDITLIAEHKSRRRIEHAETLRHIVEGGIEERFLVPLGLRLHTQFVVLQLPPAQENGSNDHKGQQD